MPYLRQSHNVKPVRYGSDADVQYSIAKNSEKIYGVDHKSNVLVMPLFFGFPCLDFSGKNNHGTPVGGVAYHSGSLDFVAANSNYIRTTFNPYNIIGNGNPFTVCTRFFIKTYPETYHCLVGTTGVDPRFYLLIKSDSTVVLGLGSIFWSSTANIVQSAWQDVDWTYDGTYERIYVTGSLKDSNNVGSQNVGNANTLLGTLLQGSYLYFLNGLIDEVRINNITLTAEQITLFYARPWDLYRRVGRTYYSVAAAPSVYIPRIMIF